MADDKKNRGHPDRDLVSEDEKYEVEHFRSAIKEHNPWFEDGLTEAELTQMISECFEELKPSRSRPKMTECVISKARRLATKKLARKIIPPDNSAA